MICLFKLRVLVAYESDYRYFVAHCLETGTVATADDSATVREMILEILHDEIAYALKHRDLLNLFSSAAPLAVWCRWIKAAAGTAEQFPLDVRNDLGIEPRSVALVELCEEKL